MPHQVVAKLDTAQDRHKAPEAIKTMDIVDDVKIMTDTVVLTYPEPTTIMNNASTDHGIVFDDGVSKLKTPAITIASSDVSFDDTMSTRSSNSSLGTEMTGPPATDDKMEVSNETKVSEISERILDVILKYSLNKFESTSELHSKGRPKFLAVISRFVQEQQKVVMCLPAFPFKSANKVEKVLGSLPDKAEEVSLARLNSMCTTIGQFYEPGAQLTIISDGLVYNGSFTSFISASN